MRWLLFAALALGCGEPTDITVPNHMRSSQGGVLDGSSDGASLDGASAQLRDLGSANADLAPAPTAAQCFMGWPNLGGGCPAPIITKAGKTSDCDGTLGWEVIGANFQFGQDNSAQHLADTGTELWEDDPSMMRQLTDRWNVLTTTRLCITSSQTGPGANKVFVINLDGKRSNTVPYQL
jgi:hypothetical protein